MERDKLKNRNLMLAIFTGLALIYWAMFFLNGFLARGFLSDKTVYYIALIAFNGMLLLLVVLLKQGQGWDWSELGWKKKDMAESIRWVLRTGAVIWGLQIVYFAVLTLFAVTTAEQTVSSYLESPSFFQFLLNLFLLAGLTPVAEESLFRGLLFRSMEGCWGRWPAVVLCSLLFAALHMDLVGFLPRFLLGVGLNYLYIKTDSLLPAMGLHGLNNSISVVFLALNA